jgi:hypothetical protein
MRRTGLVFVIALVVLSAAATAHAQSTRRPDLNLFGRGLRDPRQSLAVRGNLGGTFYDALRAPQFDLQGEPIPDHGWGSFGSAALVYNLRLANVNIDGSLGAFATYYPRLADPLRVRTLPGAGVSAGWSYALSDKTQLGFNTGLRYSPLQGESVLPGGFGGVGGSFELTADPNAAFLPPEVAGVDGNYLSFQSGADLRHQLTRRIWTTANYQYRRDETFGNEALTGLGLWSQSAGAALHFSITQNLSVRGGYVFHESHFDDEQGALRTHNADVGVDYGRGLVLQLTRRTTLSFGGGASAIADRAGGRRYRLNGNVNLDHAIGRTWSSGVSYVRSVDSSQILFREPLLNDTVTARLNGIVSRRVGFHAAASAQRGAVGFIDPDNGITRAVANVGIQTGFGRHLALGIDYSYFRYHYDSSVARPSGLPSDSASQGVYVYLTAWAPIFQRGGRTNAAR